jgi:hypothetical protein
VFVGTGPSETLAQGTNATNATGAAGGAAGGGPITVVMPAMRWTLHSLMLTRLTLLLVLWWLAVLF